MNLINFLNNNSLDDLKDSLAISVVKHPSEELYSFKYNQIDSPRFHPIVDECRGIVLEKLSERDWKLVAKPFNRFFNWGEDPRQKDFKWSDSTLVTNKEDGSLIIVYYHGGEWCINTSGSFGMGQAQYYSGSWQELFRRFCTADLDAMRTDCTYLFELCTPYNKVVRKYKPTTFLLGVFQLKDNAARELNWSEVLSEARRINAITPPFFYADNLEDVKEELAGIEEYDKTFEGFVIRDANKMRAKIKTSSYWRLHHLKDNGNIFAAKKLVPIVLNGEEHEAIAVFEELEPAIKEIKETLADEFNKLEQLWLTSKSIESQKEFALAVKDSTFCSFLFKARKNSESLQSIWRDGAEYIAEKLFSSKKFIPVGDFGNDLCGEKVIERGADQ